MSAHWDFFKLPPFFTQQPSSTTCERQTSLWTALLLDHATHHAQLNVASASTCPVLRLYRADSDVFYNASINRRLHAEGARYMLEALVSQHPSHATVVSGGDGPDFTVLVATNEGGLQELEQSLLSWLLEMGHGTTTAMLAKKGTVMTFDELSQAHALEYKLKPLRLSKRTSAASVPVRDVGALSQEQAIRTFLEALNNRPVSVMHPFKITLFNLDGSAKQPYEGVKFGGD
ncbi:ESCRT-II complex subunit VPS25 [Strigomonas culicis]|uniref:ESCRT-II complex subunit VPS25 n=1 Tax=Strigomonas culicis TaxID=28005 RepID=S9UNZ8_9TRYP|nr:ESCRT-II complex subunit VPS25 [Strigomonas culicis]|eukprot:EPY30484.1 ESCRT-II complex subunit VPS25 [Strigomonas culicis]